ncbi:MAG: type 1 glutamine amidotransferase [bacterium]
MRDTATVLAVNLLLQRSGRRSFDESVTAAGRRLGLDCTVVYPDALDTARIEDYSQIVLSGSEASILEKQSWDEDLHTLVDAAAHAETPLLGICYGAQFIARHFGGADAVGRLPVPEFGYARISVPPLDADRDGAPGRDNALFHAISDPVCVEIHYDCIRHAPAGFIVLSSNDVSIQIIRHETLPIVAYQFHPEMSHGYAEKVFGKLQTEEPRFDDAWRNDPAGLPAADLASALEQGERFLTNFLRGGAGASRTGGPRTGGPRTRAADAVTGGSTTG